MTEFDRRQMLIGLTLTAGAGLTYLSQPERRATAVSTTALAQAAPDRIGAWQSVTLPDFVLPVATSLENAIYVSVVRTFGTDRGVN